MRTPQAQYERDFTALKHYLIGRDYPEALKALGIAVRWHVGYRKDRVTPQLHHQIWVCFNFLNTPIKGLTPAQEEHSLAALLLHDVVEDHPVTFDDLRKEGIKPYTIELVKGMTKVDNETDGELHDRLLAHWLLPIMKACDRDNNVETMQGAFALPKMKSYIHETKVHILALLKKAGNMFPEHHRSYSALGRGIKKQLRIYEGFIAAIEAKEQQVVDLGDQLVAARGFSDQQAAILAETTRSLSDKNAAIAEALRSEQDKAIALLQVNQQLRDALNAQKLTTQPHDLLAFKIAATASKVNFARTDHVTRFVSEVKRLLAGGELQPDIMGANVNAEVIDGNSRVINADNAYGLNQLQGHSLRTE